MTDLSALREARQGIDLARLNLHNAVKATKAKGVPVPVIAKELGVTRQRVYQMLRDGVAAKPLGVDPEIQALRDRLAELDKRWNTMVDRLAPAFVRPDQKQETGARNKVAKKRANKGLPPLRTVKAEARAFAEEHVLEYITNHPELAACQVAGRELVEADAIREQLTALADSAF